MRGKVGQSYHTAPDNNANKGYLRAHSRIKHQRVMSYTLSCSASPWNVGISGKVCHRKQQSCGSRERSSWPRLTTTIAGAVSLHRRLRKEIYSRRRNVHLLFPEAELSQTSPRPLVQGWPRSRGGTDIASETALLENTLLFIVGDISGKVGDPTVQTHTFLQ